MLAVKIISGTYGCKIKGRIVPKDHTSEPFSLDDAEAKRLVSLGVAEIITEGVQAGGNDVGGSLDAKQLEDMTNKELKALAVDMGIDTSKFKVKDDYIQAIVAVEVSATICDENGETPPDISPEAPVV